MTFRAAWIVSTYWMLGSFALSLAQTSSSSTRTIARTPDRPEKHGSFGLLVAAAGDIDHDGTPDLLVADPGLEGERGAVWAISGKDGRVLHAVFGEAAGDGFGVDLRAAGDVDADGCADWIVGAGSRYYPKEMSGYAAVYSGRTGRLLHRFASLNKGDAFGTTVSGAGDVDNDGHADLVVGTYGADGKGDAMGVAYVFSGLDGLLVHVLGRRSSIYERAIDVSGIGDVNGDRFADVAVSVVDESAPVHAAPEVRVYSGKDGSTLFTIPSPTTREVRRARAAGDADGDGRPDILVAAVGGVAIVSGRDGRLLRNWTGDAKEDFGWDAASMGDVDGDRFFDVLISSSKAMLWSGRIELFSGREGKRIYTLDAPEDVHHLGYSIAAIGDVDGDGISDIAIGTDQSRAGEDGVVEVHSGRSGALLYLLYRRGDELLSTGIKQRR